MAVEDSVSHSQKNVCYAWEENAENIWIENEVAKDWKKFRNEELHYFCSSQNILELLNKNEVRWARA
jgi:hypothetical protein